MSLSPHGSSALVTGSLHKGLSIMVLGGVLAWVSGQSWSLERGGPEFFPLVMAFATIIAIAIPAQLVAGRRAQAWLMATAGAFGIAVPWFFALAVRQQGQGMITPSLIVFAASWAVTFLACRVTRRLAWPKVLKAKKVRTKART